ncbi:MAG TPA: class I SAM-dependent methyltransferase [Nitrososphaeraceae archaeon]
MTDPNELTEKDYWENYWKTANTGPVEIKRTGRGLSINAILDVFDKYLPVNENFHVLEIGGAPGQYLIYMARNFNYHLHSLDYSNIGNEQTLMNLGAANIDVKVYERDLFSDNFNKDLPQFDLVYSLGFIEHFENLTVVVKKHLDFLKPDGILLLGVPNLGGIYRLFLEKTAPRHLAIHNLNSMKIKNWIKFEKELNLTALFTGYISGFEPLVINKLEKKDRVAYSLNFMVRNLARIFSYRLNFLRKFNSRYWSGYLIGIYRKN